MAHHELGRRAEKDAMLFSLLQSELSVISAGTSFIAFSLSAQSRLSFHPFQCSST